MPVPRHCCAGDLREEEARELVNLLNRVWPNETVVVDDAVDRFIAGDRRHWETFCVWDDGHAIAHAAVFPRSIRHEGGELEVMALAGVCVARHRRGEGLGRQVARAALARVDQGQFPVALFQTEIPDFYARFGAVTVDNVFWNSRATGDANARPWWDPHVMTYPEVPGWPQGHIDLNGAAY